MKMIPELMEEVVAVLAKHYGASVEETCSAYLSDVGNVQADVKLLYLKTYHAVLQDLKAEASS